MLLLPYPVIDPTLLQVGALHIRWYGLMYVLAFAAAYVLMRRLGRQEGRVRLDGEAVGDLLTYAVVGVILGGRIGYVLFYNLPYYLAHPLEILSVWNGGMSFHGGLAGAAAALFIFARRRRIPFLALADLAVVPGSLGLAFGRIGNFINGELVGRPSDLPWAMIFPGEAVPRHPVQLYAAAKDILLFLILWQVYRRAPRTGMTAAAFLVLYGVLRFAVEFVRQPDPQIGFIGPFTLGQLLTLPLLAAGLLLGWWRMRMEGNETGRTA